MYTYRAKIVSVYDGDTVTAEMDLGFNVKIKEKLRLLGINAPEVRGSEKIKGKESRDWLRKRILGKWLTVHTLRDKKGKYGRYLASIYFEGDDTTINEQIVSAGHAVWRKY